MHVPFFDQSCGSKSEPILLHVWRYCNHNEPQETQITRATVTIFCKLQRKQLQWSLQVTKSDCDAALTKSESYKNHRFNCRTVPTMDCNTPQAVMVCCAVQDKNHVHTNLSFKKFGLIFYSQGGSPSLWIREGGPCGHP